MSKITKYNYIPQIPPSPETHSEYDKNINTSSDKLWTNDREIHWKIHNKFKVLSTNIRSLSKNFAELSQLVETYHPDIITLSEVWDPHIGVANLNDYHDLTMKTRKLDLSNKSRSKKSKKKKKSNIGGGVGIYISKKHKVQQLENINKIKMSCLEATAVKVFIDKYVIEIVSIYRPPHSSTNNTIHDLKTLFESMGNGNIIIAGDLNINLKSKKCSRLRTEYEKLLTNFGLNQYVKYFTRITAKSSSLIDHVLSNMIDLETIVTHDMCADHQTILSLWGTVDKSKNPPVRLNVENTTDKIHIEKTIENLKKTNWLNWNASTENLDIDSMYESFHTITKDALVYETAQSRKLKPLKNWMTKELLLKRLEVTKMRKKFYKCRTEANEQSFKNISKEYKNEIKTAKIEFYADKLKKAGKDCKKIWQVIKDVLNRKSKSEKHESIIYQNKKITDKQEIANIFSEHYKNAAVDKIKTLNSNMQFEQFLKDYENLENTFELKRLSRMETWFFIKSVQPKNSHGFDGITSKLMNSAASNLVIPMTTIINKCFTSGSFPDKLKLSKISPIHKKLDPEPANFRPISLLSCYSKVIEKAAADQLQKHFNKHLENEKQFAYKPNHSCLHALLLTRHKIEMELEKGNYVGLALVDMSLAFDTVECEKILPGKLKHYGATETTANFFKSFFTNRKLYTTWYGTNSDVVNMHNYSCVQGSCLGPTIFNVYTQDLKDTTIGDVICFADDTNVVMSDRDPNQLIRNMSNELSKIQRYMTENTLMLNKNKSNYLIFRPKRTKKIDITEKMHIDGEAIEKVTSARFLGIWIDDQLNFQKQYEILHNKLNDTLKALRAVRSLMNYRSKLLIYHSLFQSHVNYCAIAYFDKFNKSQINNLLVLQKQAIRAIFQTKRNVHTQKLFQLANITPIDKIYETEATKFVFQYVSDTTKELQPKAIHDIIFQNAVIFKNTRFYDDESKIRIPHAYCKGQAIYNLLSNWNSIKPDLRFAGNLWSLRKMIRTEVNNNLLPCTTKNCFTCQLDKNRDYTRYMRR